VCFGGGSDYPNGPDDPTATDDQHAADPPAEVDNEEDVPEGGADARTSPVPSSSSSLPGREVNAVRSYTQSTPLFPLPNKS
jgi:hypothetical protein